jgi:multidrug resistance protein MdtO
MLMSRTKQPISLFRRLERILRAELAYYPGRLWLGGRIVIACTTVMILIMIFRIPAAALGAYYPLLISRESPQATRKSAMRIALACTLGTIEIILGGVLTAGSPFLHFFWVLANLFIVFYLISSLKFTDAALSLSVIIAVAIEVWDDPVSGAMRVEHSLYTLLSVLLACLISAIVETLFAKRNPPDAVLKGVQQRLALVEQLLRNSKSGVHHSAALGIQLNRYATRGMGDLRDLLADSNYVEEYKEQLSAVLALTGQLVELSFNLSESTIPLSKRDLGCCLIVADRVSSIRASLMKEEAPDWLGTPDTLHADSAILVEIERTADLIAQSFDDGSSTVHHHLPTTVAPSPNQGIFVPDAFKSMEHFKFALRGMLTGLFCYLFYMSTGWMAPGGSIATCFLTALPNTGASRHKLTLRFSGFFLGACVLGLTAEVLILPRIDTLLEFALLFASVIAIGAWVATSGPRIAYCGFQIVLAYDLVNLNKFTINTSLIPVRDAILGIGLSVVGMRLIFDHLWAKSSTVSVRSLLLASMKDIARIQRPVGESIPILNQRLVSENSRINRSFDRVRSLSDFYVFESYPKTREEIVVDQFVRTLLPQVRTLLLLKTGLLQHHLLDGSERANTLAQEVQERSSEIMFDLANSLEHLSLSPIPVARDKELGILVRAELRAAQRDVDKKRIIEMRLCASLFDLAGHVRQSLQSMLEGHSTTTQLSIALKER